MSSQVPHKIKGIKWYFWVGGAAAVAMVAYSYRKSSAAAAAPTDPLADPNALSVFDPGYSTIGSSLSSYVDPVTGATIGGAGAIGPPVVLRPTTNAEWAQQAEAYLTQTGYDSVTVAVAIGKFLFGGGLTSDQFQIVQAAVAFEGYPPVSVPPPHMVPPTGQTNPPVTPSGGTFIVPGKLNQHVSLRTVAASLLPRGANANAIQTELKRLVAANPALRGHTTTLGGHRLNRP